MRPIRSDRVKIQGIIVDLESGAISSHGIQKEEKLTVYERRALRCYLEHHPEVASFSDIYDSVWVREGGEWDAARLNTLQKFNSEIKRKCGLKERLVKKCDENGYRLNQNLQVEWLENFALVTLSLEDALAEPEGYIHPTDWLMQMKGAFRKSQVHAITGDRGIGKTELARRFAGECMRSRPDCDSSEESYPYFRNVVFARYLEQGLPGTVEMLPCVGNGQNQISYQQKLELLQKLEKPALLILDNYDSADRREEELSEASSVYRDLRATGCHILLTSRVDLRSCFAIQQTKLEPLPEESLIALFYDLADGISAEEKEEVRELIRDCLRDNTYLVRLAAGLTATRSLTEILQAFRSLRVEELEDPIDGKDQSVGSLMEHYRTLFRLSALHQDRGSCRVLACLAMLPLEGMDYNDFFCSAFPAEERRRYRLAFKNLQDAGWVSLRSRKVSLHPLVREMVLRELSADDLKFASFYLHELNRKLNIEVYEPELPALAGRCLAAIDAVNLCGIRNRESLCLKANAASAFDTLGNRELAGQYGAAALSDLKDLSIGTDADRKEAGHLYNVTGYALLHSGQAGALEMAENALERAQRLLEEIVFPDAGTERTAEANRGNLAAVQLAKGDYAKALELHKENFARRKALLGDEKQPEQLRLAAASAKGAATACFYLAGEVVSDSDAEEMLRRSCRYHEQAIAYYEQAYTPDYHVDIAAAQNRRAGSLCRLAEYLPPEERIPLLKEQMRAMQHAIRYLTAMEMPNEDELANSRRNVQILTGLLQADNAMDWEMEQCAALS